MCNFFPPRSQKVLNCFKTICPAVRASSVCHGACVKGNNVLRYFNPHASNLLSLTKKNFKTFLKTKTKNPHH